MATNLAVLWDFDDPPGSETRLREAAAATVDPVEASILRTQLARALGLQERYDEAHDLLKALPTGNAEVAVRVLLERGRLRRSAGAADLARPLFDIAAETAAGHGLDALAVDALHMVALTVPSEQQLAATEARPGPGTLVERPGGPRLGALPAQQHRHGTRRRR